MRHRARPDIARSREKERKKRGENSVPYLLFMRHATPLQERFNERTGLSFISTSSYKLSAFLSIVNVRAGNLEI